MKNSDGQTPSDLFTKAHQGLQEAGEKWMKDISNSCMIVATLIATVVFAAAFTLPGGENQQTGPPVLLGSNWFMVFFRSDAIAFISSTTSISIFLSILTSRYTERFPPAVTCKIDVWICGTLHLYSWHGGSFHCNLFFDLWEQNDKGSESYNRFVCCPSHFVYLATLWSLGWCNPFSIPVQVSFLAT